LEEYHVGCVETLVKKSPPDGPDDTPNVIQTMILFQQDKDRVKVVPMVKTGVGDAGNDTSRVNHFNLSYHTWEDNRGTHFYKGDCVLVIKRWANPTAKNPTMI
jgi:hypothetical protein